jgi:hypothetical protein
VLIRHAAHHYRIDKVIELWQVTSRICTRFNVLVAGTKSGGKQCKK